MGKPKKERLRELFMVSKCPVCGKQFIPTSQHVYKDKRKGHKNVCSWTCVLQSERLHEAALKSKKNKR